MSDWNGLERRKNPCSTIVRDWRRALQAEWDADSRRRETHRNDATTGPDATGLLDPIQSLPPSTHSCDPHQPEDPTGRWPAARVAEATTVDPEDTEI